MYYIFHGDDQHSISETLSELQTKMGDESMLDLNTIRFEGPGVPLSELLHACNSMPFLADKRLVIVRDLLSSGPSYLDELLDYLPNLPETTRLVFIENRKLPANHRAIMLAKDDESGFVKLFKRPEGGNLERWIRRRVQAKGGNITPHAAHVLSISVGNDLGILDNEVEKLVLYKGREAIETDDVALLCPYAAEASIFELVDAIGTRHGPTAAQTLHRKFSEGSDPAYLYAMIVRQFRLMIQVKELAEAGNGQQAIAKKLRIHHYVSGKVLQQSRNFTWSQLEQIYRHLLDVDIGVKTGQTDMITALDLFVAGVTT